MRKFVNYGRKKFYNIGPWYHQRNKKLFVIAYTVE